MPRTYIRKTERARWTKEDLKGALNDIANGIKIRRAARIHSIPFSTLQSRLKNQKTNPGSRLGRNSVFSEEQEEMISQHVKLMAKLFYGLTPKQLRKIAFEFAEKNYIANTFNNVKKLAGKDW
jgi:hypothetical protein